jgi:hypothetical protein
MGYEKEGYYEASTYLGQRVGKQHQFLQKTACMDIKVRKSLAVFEFMKKKNPEFKEQIEEFESLLTFLGAALWNRDVITDLALKLGQKSNVQSFKKGKYKDVDSAELENDTSQNI